MTTFRNTTCAAGRRTSSGKQGAGVEPTTEQAASVETTSEQAEGLDDQGEDDSSSLPEPVQAPAKDLEKQGEDDTSSVPKPVQAPTLDLDLESQMADIQGIVTVQQKSTTDCSKEQAKLVLTKIQKIKDLGLRTTIHGVTALFRKGGANAGAADSMEVEVECPETGVSTEISRYDVGMALNSVTGHKNIRKLAEIMAPEMISANLKLIKDHPLLDLKGDLANRINRKLSIRKEDSLTREEEICCSTYSQWMPNLNDLANSKRLKNLLDEDLNARRKRQGKDNDKKPNKADPKKVDPKKADPKNTGSNKAPTKKGSK